MKFTILLAKQRENNMISQTQNKLKKKDLVITEMQLFQ